ncbi:hypothetical protein [Pyrinomonas methylaliphatogenes]|uniref:Uncharacterized protein n=1 Tax=Pyrinomonas methylaliphatogenes TaxID=454194 RepID=A0A0B6X343_9BACT|nr:hypothetical protein [Pyrinomonas methylaliphatogenes]CDM66720.1 hypothetical protein PYK22_02753 [Pyrinomonas methylaliphatogenes]
MRQVFDHIQKYRSEKQEVSMANRPINEAEAELLIEKHLRERGWSIIETYGDLDYNALLKAVYEKYPAYARRSRLKHNKRSQ